MAEPYNRLSGQSLESLTALSDGVFAVAMTLLVLDLRVPASGVSAVTSEHGLWHGLLRLGPGFAAYALSFTLLGTFWLAQHTLLGLIERSDRVLAWSHLGFLFMVTLLPFSAVVLADFVHLRLAVGVYWLNIFLLGLGLEVGSRHIRVALLPDEPQAAARLGTFRRRIYRAQALYATAALICFINTVASVIALALVQTFFILSPQRRRASATYSSN